MHVGAEAEAAVVGFDQALVVGAEPKDGLDRAENLVAGEVTVVVDVAEHGGGDEPALGQVTTEPAPPAEQTSKAVQSEAAVPETPFDPPVAPQSPDVAPGEAPATKKATRAKKTPVAAETKEAGAPRAGSKTSQVIAMLKREGGTTLEEIMTEMKWLKHTTRAVLSAGGSLTKNHGLIVTSEKVGDNRIYSIKA